MNKTVLKLNGSDDYFISEAYKTLRTNVRFCGQDIKVIAVTSNSAGEGKTTVSLNLGVSLAELGKRVLIIDTDMRKSVMAGRDSNARGAKGLSELLTGMCDLNEALYKTQYDGLSIIFAGQYPPNPVELLSSLYFGKLIDSARETYDYIIVDTPPLGMVVDAAVVAAHCDGAIFVMGKNVRCAEAQEVVGMIEKSGCRMLGAVINNAESKHKAYYRRADGDKSRKKLSFESIIQSFLLLFSKKR